MRLKRLPVLIGALAAPWLAFLALDRLFPLPLPGPDRFAVVVAAEDGTPLRSFADRDGVWRYPVTVAEVSPRYLEALIHYEDRHFYRHAGVNPLAMARALLQFVRHGRAVSGGSTLTMQVARILDPHERDLGGKLKQMFRALQLEHRYSKEEILTLYLNHAPFGGPIEGVQAASYAYLGKPAKHLSHAEAALLAVLPQSPTRIRPDREPARAQAARDKVLARMAKFGVWSEAEVAAARQEVVSAWPLERPMLAPLLARRLKESGVAGESLRTTLDAGLQLRLEQLVRDYSARLPPHSSAAALVVDNQTLAVRAYVGSPDLLDGERYGHVDMVRAVRSPGSTLKPFLYGIAIEDGLIHSHSLLVDAPRAFDGYRPGNFGGGFSGPVSVTDALQRSLNVPAVDLLERLGPSYFAARLRQGGLALSYPDGGQPSLAMVLGGVGASLEGLVSAYTALGRGGRAGELRYTPAAPLREHPLLSEGSAWIVRRMLTVDPAFGATRYRSGEPIAWKTGTSYGFRDAWAIGVSGRHTIGVWLGRPDGTPMPGHYGAVTAAPLLFQAFALLPRAPAAEPAPPASVREALICWPLGQPPKGEDDPFCQQKHVAWLYQGMTPPTLPDRDDDKWLGNPVTVKVHPRTGRRVSARCEVEGALTRTIARWPKAALPWLAPAARRESRLPPIDRACGAPPALESVRITSLQPDAVLRPAGASDELPSVPLEATGGSGQLYWLLDGQQIATTPLGGSTRFRFLRGGAFQLTVLDEEGNFDSIRLQVRTRR